MRGWEGPPAAANGKAVFARPVSGSLVLLDTSGVEVTQVAEFSPQNGGRLNCPLWSPSGDALAFVEAGTSPTAVYLVRWPQDGPQPPEKILERDEPISALKLIEA